MTLMHISGGSFINKVKNKLITILTSYYLIVNLGYLKYCWILRSIENLLSIDLSKFTEYAQYSFNFLLQIRNLKHLLLQDQYLLELMSTLKGLASLATFIGETNSYFKEKVI